MERRTVNRGGGRDRGDDDRGSSRSSRSDRGGRDRDDDDRGGRGGRSSGGRGGSSNFHYHRPSADETRKRAEQSSTNYDSIFQEGVKEFRPEGGDYTMRLLPATWKDPTHFGIDLHIHYGVGPDDQKYLCPKEMRGDPCPICEERELAVRDGDKDYANSLKPTKRVLYYLVDRDAEREGVQAWPAPWTVDRDLNNIIIDKKTGEVLPIDDPDNGYDVSFSREGKGMKTKYIGLQVARRESDLGSVKWLDFAVDNPLPDILKVYSYDHINQVFGGGGSKGGDPLSERQDRELRDVEERSTRGSSSRDSRRGESSDDTKLTWESIHSMEYAELCAIVDDEKLDIRPEDSKDDEDLADWICEEMRIRKPQEGGGRERLSRMPRDA